MRIYKYRLSSSCINEMQTVSMPIGSKILDVQFMENQLVLWAEVDPEAEVRDRLFLIAFTGSEAPARQSWTHVSTLQVVRRTTFVLHIFAGPDF